MNLVLTYLSSHSKELKEDLEALSLEDSLTLPPLRSEKVAAGDLASPGSPGSPSMASSLSVAFLSFC
jgi:hypothetical protein